MENIQRLRLLAAETLLQQCLGDYSPADPATAIVKVERELARLFVMELLASSAYYEAVFQGRVAILPD